MGDSFALCYTDAEREMMIESWEQGMLAENLFGNQNASSPVIEPVK